MRHGRLHKLAGSGELRMVWRGFEIGAPHASVGSYEHEKGKKERGGRGQRG